MVVGQDLVTAGGQQRAHLGRCQIGLEPDQEFIGNIALNQGLIDGQLLNRFTAGLSVLPQAIPTLGGGIRGPMLTENRIRIPRAAPDLDLIDPAPESPGHGRAAPHTTADGDFRNGITGNIGQRQGSIG